MSLNRSIGDVQYMEKRIPKNAKYQHVKTRLDTGCSLTKYLERLEEIKRNYRYRKDEIFKRLKVTTFAQLVLQVTSVSDLSESENDFELHDPEDGDVVSGADPECLSECTSLTECQDPREICTARSTLLSVISGVGELNLDRNNETTQTESLSSPEPVDTPYPDCPYLLLDVRGQEQYDLCHIISAHSFPITMLSRTMNPYTKEVLEHKNAAGKIIIVYDEDERLASQAATIMCERGFENLFMLSGGLKVVAQKFPEGLTTGSIPMSCRSSPTSLKGKKAPGQQQQLQAAEKRWRFTSDELAKIHEQLDEIFISSDSNSRMSSRMSTVSSQSKASSTRSRQSSSTAGRDSNRGQSSRPWK